MGKCTQFPLRLTEAHALCCGQLASVDHDPVLCAAPARSRHDQVEPQRIIADGTDWRFLDELKRELKT